MNESRSRRISIESVRARAVVITLVAFPFLVSCGVAQESAPAERWEGFEYRTLPDSLNLLQVDGFAIGVIAGPEFEGLAIDWVRPVGETNDRRSMLWLSMLEGSPTWSRVIDAVDIGEVKDGEWVVFGIPGCWRDEVDDPALIGLVDLPDFDNPRVDVEVAVVRPKKVWRVDPTIPAIVEASTEGVYCGVEGG